MEIERAFVRQEDYAVVLKCPHCGTARDRFVGKFKGPRRQVKVRCLCHFVFRVLLEFRKTFRKGAELQGYYVQLSATGEYGEMLIRNLSISGIGFVTLTKHNLSQGDAVKVEFTLDDERSSKIEKKAFVRWVKDREVGCEFIVSTRQDTGYDTALNFYLIPS